MNRLTELANKYETDKGTLVGARHNYTDFYEPYFKEFGKVYILEIGVFNGGSLKMYNEYYNGNCEIYAIDIEDKREYETDNIHIFQVDQSSREDLDNFIAKIQGIKFDIILDDGSHMLPHQLISMAKLYKLLKPNGIYIIEDLHSSVAPIYSEDFIDSPLYFITMLEPSKFLTEEENAQLLSDIKDVCVKSRLNTECEEWRLSGCKNRSITSVITFK